MPVNLQHLQHAVNATKTEKEHFQLPCAVSGIQNNFNLTRNSVEMHQIPSMEEKSATSSAKPVSLLRITSVTHF